VLQPGELVTAVCIPERTRTWRAQYRKVGRVMKDLAQVNCAVALEVRGGSVSLARVVLGAVHPVVVRVRDAEGLLASAGLRSAAWPAAVVAAVSAVRHFVQPITDVRASREWRRHVAGVLVERCLRGAADPRTAGRVPRLEDGPSYCAGLASEATR
jgi:carbon-monoxide dehydrogenase medium subunit